MTVRPKCGDEPRPDAPAARDRRLLPGNSEKSASFTVGDKNVVLMLFVADIFSGVTNHAVADTAAGSEVLFSLCADSREQVDDMQIAPSRGAVRFSANLMNRLVLYTDAAFAIPMATDGMSLKMPKYRW